jgi:molecular chaperone GrpE (heat shock protein)
MADETTRKPGDGEDDDTYVLEDTGETLDDFSLEEVPPAAASDPDPQTTSEGGNPGDSQKLRDQLLRSLADFDNYRKRTERERADFHRYATSNLLRDLLPILDNFERALSHAPDEEFGRGVALIYKQLMDTLTRNGLRPIEEANVPFDPNIHEGVMREETDQYPSHTVTEVLQKGYFLHDRLLRPAMVKVAVGGPEGGGQPQA